MQKLDNLKNSENYKMFYNFITKCISSSLRLIRMDLISRLILIININ